MTLTLALGARGSADDVMKPTAAPAIVVLIVILGLIDIHRQKTRALLANLGVPLPTTGALIAIAATAGEVLLQLSVRFAMRLA